MFYLVVSLCNYGLYTVFVQKGKKTTATNTLTSWSLQSCWWCIMCGCGMGRYSDCGGRVTGLVTVISGAAMGSQVTSPQ